jgi:hypothetical protein
MKRVFNIIERAINEFDMDVDMSDSLQDIFDQAQNTIDDNVEYDYISECESSKHHEHISWSDDNGFSYEADGQFLSGDDRHNTYFRYNGNGEYEKIDWFEHDENDYVLMDYVIDTDGQKVALVSL